LDSAIELGFAQHVDPFESTRGLYVRPMSVGSSEKYCLLVMIKVGVKSPNPEIALKSVSWERSRISGTVISFELVRAEVTTGPTFRFFGALTLVHLGSKRATKGTFSHDL
jgi:hypothetical protein